MQIQVSRGCRKIEPAKMRFGCGLSQVASTAISDGLTPYELATGFAGSCAAVLTTAGADDHYVAKTFRALADCFDGRGERDV